MNNLLNFRLNTRSMYSSIAYSHSWSNLATAFNTRPENKFEKRSKETVGLFHVDELQCSEGFEILKAKCTKKSNELVDEAISENRTRKMVQIFDELSDTLCKVADLSEFIRVAHPRNDYNQSAESACNTISGIVEKLNTNRKLYTALSNVIKHGDIESTTDVDDHVAKLFQFDFEQSGIHLPETLRHQVVTLNNNILTLGQHFTNGTSSPRIINKHSLPEQFKNTFQVDGDSIIVSNLYADTSNPITREMAYRIFLYPDKQQEYLLSELLQSRYELAKICGFHTYAERALKGSLFENPKSVIEFLNRLSENLKSHASTDIELMSKFKKLDTKSENLAAWDVAYYTYKIRKDLFQVGAAEYSPYFSLGTCMDGLNQLIDSLFGITFKNLPISPGEGWSSDIYKLAVVHEDEGLLGYIYCDFFEREGKPHQDCHFTIQGGKVLEDGSYQTPIVVLMLNFQLPHWSKPTLLSPSMVDNLFHEMGHAMHSMLARTSYQHVTGTRCSTDLAEVPSVLMEYFAADPRILRKFARHYQTMEVIPEDLLQKLCASKNLFTASEMQLQVFYSLLDQLYHGEHPLNGTTTDVLANIQNKYCSLPYVDNTAWQLRFSHLFGYGAKYYSYLVSRALASWIWETYFAANPLNRSHGEKYRRDCLAFGGGKPSYNLIRDFLQREPTPVLLADALTNEIAHKKNSMNLLKDIYKFL